MGNLIPGKDHHPEDSKVWIIGICNEEVYFRIANWALLSLALEFNLESILPVRRVHHARIIYSVIIIQSRPCSGWQDTMALRDAAPFSHLVVS